MKTAAQALLFILLIAYFMAAIISFGHSAVLFQRDNDFIAIMNTSTFGAAWPFYASYIYFKEEKTDG